MRVTLCAAPTTVQVQVPLVHRGRGVLVPPIFFGLKPRHNRQPHSVFGRYLIRVQMTTLPFTFTVRLYFCNDMNETVDILKVQVNE